jgi:addiction module HigA family antidote
MLREVALPAEFRTKSQSARHDKSIFCGPQQPSKKRVSPVMGALPRCLVPSRLDCTYMCTLGGGLDLTGKDRMPTTSKSRKDNDKTNLEVQSERRPTAPGDILRQEFLAAHNIKQHDLADAMGVSRFRINEVINGKRAITAETALLLAAALDTTPEFWLNLQRAIDLHEGRLELQSDLKRVKRLIRKRSAKEIFYEISKD